MVHFLGGGSGFGIDNLFWVGSMRGGRVAGVFGGKSCWLIKFLENIDRAE